MRKELTEIHYRLRCPTLPVGATERIRRHTLAAETGAMLDCSPSPVERIPGGTALLARPRGTAASKAWGRSGGGAVEAHEIAEQIDETAEHHHGHAAHTPDWFRRLTGVYVGVIAMLLAIAALGGSDATKEMLNANIHATDTYAFYQAKYLRQIHYQTAAEQIELLVGEAPALTADQRGKADQLIKRYRETAARDESDPAKGNGKKELLVKAQKWEERRDHAAAQTPNFRIRRGAVPDRHRAGFGGDRRRLALAPRRQRRARRGRRPVHP